MQKIRRKTAKEQKRDAELGLIIDEFGRAMWNANKSYIATYGGRTPSMDVAWNKYIYFCKEHLDA
jgi:hypothetical protein